MNANTKTMFKTYGKYNKNDGFSFAKDKPRLYEIWMCYISSSSGSVQNGMRPVFVVSNNTNNRFSSVVNAFPMTTKKKSDIPVHVFLDNYEDFGLLLPSTILVEQPLTVSIEKFAWKIGEINDKNTLEKIKQAMLIQFPILSI